MEQLQSIFTKRKQENLEAAERLRKASNRLALVRLFVFLLTIGLGTWLASLKMLLPALATYALGIAAFAFLINYFRRLKAKESFKTNLAMVNERELGRQALSLKGIPNGSYFAQASHPYTADLDIFGEHSVFQLINRAATVGGSLALGKLLQQPLTHKKDIEKQQSAVRTLIEKLDWRQELEAKGKPVHAIAQENEQLNSLLQWQASSQYLQKPVYLVFAVVLGVPLVLIALFIFLKYFTLPTLLLLTIALAFNWLVLHKIHAFVEPTLEAGLPNVKLMRSYREILQQLEQTDFEEETLRQVISPMQKTEQRPSKKIANIIGVFDWMALRGSPGQSVGRNQLYGILNVFLLLDAILLLLAERWKDRNRYKIGDWLAAVANIEALSSIAGFAYANPSFHFPTIVEQEPELELEEVVHPLLPKNMRIANTFGLVGEANIVVITGSNMAGKSTFLRTVGLTLVLSQIGAPVGARSAKLPVYKLFTSMRTQDNLSTGISAFYAELKRLELLLNKLKKGEKVIFLLDELLKGTNSRDRFKGIETLIGVLKQYKAIGFISTHDLTIGELAENEGLLNYSFNSSLRNGKLEFDYKIEEGICQEFNAQDLMRSIGIKL